MLSNPVIFQRDFRNDSLSVHPFDLQRYEQIALSALPLVSLIAPLRQPLTGVLSATKVVTNFSETLNHFHHSQIQEGMVSFLQAGLSASVVGALYLNPSLSYICSTLSDSISHFQQVTEGYQANDPKQFLEGVSYVILDALFIAAIAQGTIELTVACMVLQITIGLYLSFDSYQNDNKFDAVCQLILAGTRAYQLVPQLKVLEWKWSTNPQLIGELKQTESGFTYIDLPDEYICQLKARFDDAGIELPPYFEAGKAGAHISVMRSDEVGGLTISELGQKFSFEIVQMDSLKPLGMKGVERVWFLSMTSPGLEQLRTSYDLSPRIHDTHDFHLTFALERAEVTSH